MAKKPTLTEQVAALTQTVTALVGQFSTATAVAAEVATPTAAPTLTVVPPVVTASDVLKSAVEAQGLAFARGGRTVLTTAHLTAAVRVLKTGTPEILPVENVRLEKRNVTHIALGRDGDKVITQYVFTPEGE